MKSAIIIKVDDCYNFYKLSYKRGFNELLNEIKNKYSNVELRKYRRGYFNPYKKKFIIEDHNFKNVDEFELISCVENVGSKIYFDSIKTSYQLYSGEAKTYQYSNLYRILCQELGLNFFNDLKMYLSDENIISKHQKLKILHEIFNYINFENYLSVDQNLYNRMKLEDSNNSLKLLEFNELSKFLEIISIVDKKEKIKCRQ